MTENNVAAQAGDELRCPFCDGEPRHLRKLEGIYVEALICDACNFGLAPEKWRQRAGQVSPRATDRDLEQRAEGRAEAVSLILGLDPENALEDCTVGSGPCPATGEYDTHWDEKKLRALFSAGDKFLALETKLERMYWDYQEARMVIQHEAEQRRAVSPCATADVEQESIAKLREMLQFALTQNECDMVLTGEECRKVSALLATTKPGA